MKPTTAEYRVIKHQVNTLLSWEILEQKVVIDEVSMNYKYQIEHHWCAMK